MRRLTANLTVTKASSVMNDRGGMDLECCLHGFAHMLSAISNSVKMAGKRKRLGTLRFLAFDQ